MTSPASSPRVTVILPTRDRAASLRESIESVLRQSMGDFELIVVDDASSDDSSSVAGSIEDRRLRYVRLDTPAGAARARNNALGLARSSVVAFQDSDDRWSADHLEVLVAALEQDPAAVVAYGVLRRAPSEGSGRIPGPADLTTSGDLRCILARYNIVSLPSSIARLAAIRRVGCFDEQMPRYQDWELFLRLAEVGSFVFVNQIVTEAGGGTGRISADGRAETIALRRLLAKHADLYRELPHLAVAHEAHLARMALIGTRPAEAARHLSRLAARPVHTLRWLWNRSAGRPSPLDRERIPDVS